MREIKFRIWHDDLMYMVYKMTFNANGIYEVHGQNDDARSRYHASDASKCVLMQFTDLKDKNGREVYEGDIVKGELRKAFVMPHESNPQVCTVEYDEDMQLSPFHVNVGYDGEGWTDVLIDGFEVIGNIHENPELIGVMPHD